MMEKTLGQKKDDRLPCNVEEEWLEKFKQKYLGKDGEMH